MHKQDQVSTLEDKSEDHGKNCTGVNISHQMYLFSLFCKCDSMETKTVVVITDKML